MKPSVAAALFVAIALMIGADIAADYAVGSESKHILTETVVMALAALGAVMLWKQTRAARRDAAQLTRDLEAARQQAERFHDEAKEALRGLGDAIDRQFARWTLTPAEREIALLMLKGLTHKEVAAVRATSETTIRQQALAIYRKAGLRNRSELAAFFLEDLLLPVADRSPGPSGG